MWRARTSRTVPSGASATRADGASVLDEQVEDEPPLVHLRRGRVDGGHERAFDLRAGRVAAGVDDPGDRVPALARQRERPGPVAPVEVGTELHEIADTPRTLGNQDAHRVDVTQVGTGGQRVGEVQVGRVGFVAERGRDPALRVLRGRRAPARPS